jgi:hypothetical protein
MKTEKKERVTWGDVFPKSRISIIDNGRIKKVRIEGAKKLLLCITKEVKILLTDEILYAEGEDLACTSYASGAIEVAGEITHLRFENKSKAKEGRA